VPPPRTVTVAFTLHRGKFNQESHLIFAGIQYVHEVIMIHDARATPSHEVSGGDLCAPQPHR
jgi:hypothetical protein